MMSNIICKGIHKTNISSNNSLYIQNGTIKWSISLLFISYIVQKPNHQFLSIHDYNILHQTSCFNNWTYRINLVRYWDKAIIIDMRSFFQKLWIYRYQIVFLYIKDAGKYAWLRPCTFWSDIKYNTNRPLKIL